MKTKSTWLQVRVDPEFLRVLDDWRRERALEEHKDLSRSEAIRRLVIEGIPR